MEGSSGVVVVELKYMIHPTAFSVDHLSRHFRSKELMKNAPRDFEVYVSATILSQQRDFKITFGIKSD